MRLLIVVAASCGLIAQLHLPGAGGHKNSGASGSDASGKNEAPAPNENSGTNRGPEQPKSVGRGMPDEPDGYVLELAWAPATRTRFVVSGFASQLRDGSVRESCGKPKKLPGNVVRLATPYMRTTADVQREWDAHGTCSSLDPGDYFTRMIQARVAVQLPVQLTSLEGDATASEEEIESYFAGTNTTFPPNSLQTRCANGAFAGVRVCFDPSLNPRECRPELSACGTNVRITSQPARP